VKIRLDSDYRKLLKCAERQGFGIRMTHKGHFRIDAPNGGCCFTSSTPSDVRAIRNLRSELRRIGLAWR
jgi:hypothetical protein